jgi:DnaJ-class molecular chaperone
MFGFNNINNNNNNNNNNPGGGRPAPVVLDLFCTLEELYNGCKKKMKITKQAVVPETGKLGPVEKFLTINVKKGWKQGTKVTFEKEGDEVPGKDPTDVVFVIQETPHPTLTRAGSDLIYHVNVTLLKALTGFTLEVRMPDDRIVTVTVSDVISPGATKTVAGEGMPRGRDPNLKGNLIIHFNVIFPESLSEDQKTLLTAALG